MLGIVVITYNNADFIRRQAELFKKFCKDEYELVVIDNSTKQEAIDAIKYVATDINKFRYIKTKASSINGSDSHAFAANLSYQMIKNDYDYLFYVDHDLFPTKEFSVIDILGDKLFAGIGQGKEKLYLWPGCLMIRNILFFKENNIDFSPNIPLGLDTGGNVYKMIDMFGKDSVVHFNEMYEQNPQFTKGMYQHYSVINEGMFIHFINGSGWNPSPDNQERINSLFNILESKTK